MRRYIVIYTANYYPNSWILTEDQIKDYNDGSFCDNDNNYDNKNYRVFEIAKELTLEELFTGDL